MHIRNRTPITLSQAFAQAARPARITTNTPLNSAKKQECIQIKKMNYKILLTFLLITKSTGGYEEAYVKAVDDDYDSINIETGGLGDDGESPLRNNYSRGHGRSNYNNPLVDLITKIIGNGFTSKGSNFFDFLQDQYNLPRGMKNGRCFWPRGNAVGGTSVINYMIYTRGRPQDWDRIAAAGNNGWSYNDVLKYYKKMEKADLKGYEKAYHRGRDGELPVEFVAKKTKLLNAFLEAGRILGHPTVDYNAPETLGFGKVQVTMSGGRRQSAAKAFLHTHKNRPNLHIIPESRVTKVLIDPHTKIAYGIEYIRNNVLRSVTVRKEVILSAGPIASPQLLMLSGIGPKENLNSVGINVINDLPVGKTLYDHICFPGLVFTLNETNISFLEAKATNIHSITEWLRNGDNEISSPGGVEGIGYIKTPVSEDPELVPDIELISIGGSIVSDGGPGGSKAVRRGMRITDDVFDRAFGAIDDTDTWSAFPMLLKPKSFGYLELKDNNPFSHPRLYGNYLTDPRDVATFVAAIRHVQALAKTAPFQKFGAKIHQAKYPACLSLQFDSDEYWECAVRTLTATLHHQVATCRMGPEGDPLAVVDPELRVHGMKMLRVVDTGIIPSPTSAHTNAPGMMIDDEATVEIDESLFAHPHSCDQRCEKETTRRKKDLNRATPPENSLVIEAMLKTPMLLMHQSDSDILSILRDRYDLPKGFKTPLVEYDFIVVGAGSAGSVLAARLSESRKASVLLLEAGQEESVFTSVPVLAPLFQRTDYVWPYLMEHQPGVCMGMEDERCYWPRGKAVGGSSVVNYMIYTRGLPEDWNRIAAQGNYGWSYEEVLPYYIKTERANLKGLSDSPWHGKDGELTVEYVPFRSKLSKALLDAAKLLGHRRVDYNSPDGFGFNYIQATMNRGIRMSSAKAFLHNHKNRRNLHILPNSRVTKVLIDPNTKTAQGVEFYRDGRLYEIRAKKEVILSAGPIESPHLLMLSGIGPKIHLESFGIQVIKDLKVGESLYDHISFPALTFTLNTTRLTIAERNIGTIQNAMSLMQFGDGPMTSLAGVETLGYMKTSVSDEVGEYPDVEILGACASLATDNGKFVAKGIKMADWLYNDVYRPIENIESFTVFMMLLHPKSKGHLKLKSKDPFEQPALNGNYLQHPKDVATIIAAIRHIEKLVGTTPFQKYGATIYKRKFPNCKQFTFGTDAYWECAVRTVTATLHHQIATCKMGPTTDPYAVVDPELRVYGVRNLRVVDSSIIPQTTAAHTNAPAIMIGEKGAHMIKSTWGID
ncbi:unnamed protein product, partial [Iphiclides podalirius]